MGLTGFETGYIVVYFGDVAANGEVNAYILKANRRIKIVSAQIGVGSQINANQNDYVTFTLKNGNNTVATLDSSSSNISQGITNLSVSSTYQWVSANSEVTFTVAQDGNGAAVDDLTLILRVEIAD